MGQSGIQSIERAFEIIEALAVEPKGLSITQLSQRLSLHKTTVHRILQTLLTKGYVQKDMQSMRYKLGVKFVEISSLYLNSIELRTEAHPFLCELVAMLNVTVHLAVLEGYDVIYIDKVEQVSSIRLYSSIGKRVPAYCTALGKMMLSKFSDEEVKMMFLAVPLTPFTKNTITDVEKLVEEIRVARAKGYAVDNEELQEGIRCIASPIYDYRSEMIAAISISAPVNILPPHKDEENAQKVIQTAKKISQRLGYVEKRKI